MPVCTWKMFLVWRTARYRGYRQKGRYPSPRQDAGRTHCLSTDCWHNILRVYGSLDESYPPRLILFTMMESNSGTWSKFLIFNSIRLVSPNLRRFLSLTLWEPERMGITAVIFIRYYFEYVIVILLGTSINRLPSTSGVSVRWLQLSQRGMIYHFLSVEIAFCTWQPSKFLRRKAFPHAGHL